MSKKRVLITGCNSLLGKYISRALKNDFELFGTFHKAPLDKTVFISATHQFHLDITQKADTAYLISYIRPDVVIHLAALSSIDYCEIHKDLAHEINIQGTLHLISALQNKKTRFIFSSSNAVFSGTHPPYRERDIPHPLNFYGTTKLRAEIAVKKSRLPSTIIRFTTIYGWPPLGARANDLNYYLEKLKENQRLHLVNDLFFNPISAFEAANTVKKVLTDQKRGIWHVAGKDQVSRYTLVKMIAQVFGIQNPQLVPVSHTYFSNSAKRPLRAILSIHKLERTLKFSPLSITNALSLFKRHSR